MFFTKTDDRNVLRNYASPLDTEECRKVRNNGAKGEREVDAVTRGGVGGATEFLGLEHRRKELFCITLMTV